MPRSPASLPRQTCSPKPALPVFYFPLCAPNAKLPANPQNSAPAASLREVDTVSTVSTSTRANCRWGTAPSPPSRLREGLGVGKSGFGSDAAFVFDWPTPDPSRRREGECCGRSAPNSLLFGTLRPKGRASRQPLARRTFIAACGPVGRTAPFGPRTLSLPGRGGNPAGAEKRPADTTAWPVTTI